MITKSSFRGSNPAKRLSCVHHHLPSHIRISISNKPARLDRINALPPCGESEREKAYV